MVKLCEEPALSQPPSQLGDFAPTIGPISLAATFERSSGLIDQLTDDLCHRLFA